jgi:hypothetical protein
MSYKEWKGKADNPCVVPYLVKNLLWNEILKHFTLPHGIEQKDYIKKNLTPNQTEYPKLKEHWTSFVEYKTNEDFAKASAQGNKSRGKKGRDHHLC